MAALITQESPKKISEFSHHPRAVAINFKFRPKIQRKSAISDPFFTFFFCFGHNFLTNVNFSNPFSQAIYILPVIRRDTHNDHIYGHIMSGHNGQFQQNSHNGHSCMARYGHKYGQYGCLCEVLAKGR